MEKKKLFGCILLTLLIVILCVGLIKVVHYHGLMMGTTKTIYYIEGTEGICERTNEFMFGSCCMLNSPERYTNLIDCSWGNLMVYTDKGRWGLYEKGVLSLLECRKVEIFETMSPTTQDKQTLYDFCGVEA